MMWSRLVCVLFFCFLMVTHQCSSTENYQLYVPESAQVGKRVGKIKANDEDLGINADIKYSIINSEGSYMFSISTDRDTREGIISLKKVNRHSHQHWNVQENGLMHRPWAVWMQTERWNVELWPRMVCDVDVISRQLDIVCIKYYFSTSASIVCNLQSME